jgi:hypothetical protein
MHDRGAKLRLRNRGDRIGTVPFETGKVAMDLRDRYSRIQQKEEDLRRREAELRRAKVVVDESHPPNFPPFYPMLYHNITEEIPIISQTFLRIWLANLLELWVTAVVNIIACCCTSHFTGDKYGGGAQAQNIIFGIIVGVLTVPLGFRVTYIRLYRECKASEIGFVTLGLSALFFAWIAVGAVGPPKSGMVGVIMGIDGVSGRGGFTKAISGISAALYLLAALLQLFLLGRLMLLFKASGRQLQPVTSTQ